jgi:transposase
MSEKKFTIQSYSIKELRQLYNVSVKTWSSWVAPFKEHLGDIKGKRYTPKQVAVLVSHLGEP